MEDDATHTIARPPGISDGDEMHMSAAKAREYPFALDRFQQIAISCIERYESVLVCAHTSAGKTVCAEHAIAVALRDGARVVYTSPIKALSNQKYRELVATSESMKAAQLLLRLWA